MPTNFISNFISKNKLLFQNTAKNVGLGLALGLSVLVLSVLISYLLYQPKKMVKRGFEIEIQTTATGSAAPKSQLASVDIATLLKTADIDAGAKVFKKCASCHTANQGGANKVGPNLYGIVGKSRASVSGFAYSPALKAKSGSWTVEDLNQWLTKPKDFVSGTKMGFAGLKKDKDRANVIAYLKQSK